MATDRDVLETMRRITEATGDPRAWQAGLTSSEVTAVVAPIAPGPQLDTILAKIRRWYPKVFDPEAPSAPRDPEQASEPREPAVGNRADGDAAEAIAIAEAALAHQNSVSSQLDLHVISAILNAHAATVDGGGALDDLQQQVETAVATRSDLDTPAGAREFQRFLIGKLRDIRSVVAGTRLDDTSKSALMAAWTSLYNASLAGAGTGAGVGAGAGAGAGAGVPGEFPSASGTAASGTPLSPATTPSGTPPSAASPATTASAPGP
ncbi:DUF4226 domain-containing protein, partial [Mycobacterium sp.]|uniref:DUF4226 domain-containing protein n=1 Tax=Mycobacterium sp. TaxID=1785 RepID=UPI003A84E7AA